MSVLHKYPTPRRYDRKNIENKCGTFYLILISTLTTCIYAILIIKSGIDSKIISQSPKHGKRSEETI